MNEWSGKLLAYARAVWLQWTPANRAVPIAVVAAAVVAVVLLASGGSGSAMVPLFGMPIADQDELHRIATRMDVAAVAYKIGDDQRIYVADDSTAQRTRALLMREDLIPAQADPWSPFDVDRFSRTDFERNVNLQRAVTRNLEQHLKSMDDIDAASVTIVVPERRLFSEEQEPTTASIVITPYPGSDLAENRQKIAGVQRLVAFAVAGLELQNIVIVDNRGNQLSRFAELPADGFAAIDDFDRIALTERQLQTKFDLEQSYKREVLDSLARIFTRDRVQIIRLDIDLDLDKQRTEIEEQVPAANDAVSRRSTIEERSPWAFRRITVAVAIDGLWRRLHDRRGNPVIGADSSIQREYAPVSEAELAAARRLIADAVGFDARHGDSVTVEHLPFDRSEQFRQEDAAYHRLIGQKRALAVGGVAAAAVLLALLAYRSQAFRRWRAGRVTAARQQADRSTVGPAGWSRPRGTLQEQAATLAREQPEEVARVLRTWLVDE